MTLNKALRLAVREDRHYPWVKRRRWDRPYTIYSTEYGLDLVTVDAEGVQTYRSLTVADLMASDWGYWDSRIQEAIYGEV